MSEFIFIGNKISVYALRDYIMRHRIDAGDSLVLNPHDFETIIQEMKNSPEGLHDFPVKLLEVLIAKDTTDTIPIGKLQIVKNEKPYL
ncbi:hypothetical protein [Flavobacterium sp.]|uniref:hypothetical protein n=1 Tax=Flavobacterium sp. TaxID=239 RepID=UPI0039E4A359